jgi:hypothetical protein
MFDDVYKIIGKSYDEHKETFEADSPRDFMDVFIQQINNAQKVTLNINYYSSWQIVHFLHEIKK